MGYMRIGSFKVKPDLIEEFLEIYQQEAIPIIMASHGNNGAFILQQHTDENCFMACTAWETKADAEEYDKSGKAADMVVKIRHTFDGPPTLSTYETYGI